MSEFQQAAIKETENFAKTPKEKSCQQIFNRGLSLSTASLTGCKCSKANVVVASSACWYQMFQQAIRLAIHFARRYLLVLAPNPMERRSSARSANAESGQMRLASGAPARLTSNRKIIYKAYLAFADAKVQLDDRAGTFHGFSVFCGVAESVWTRSAAAA